jgi:bla regulator protein blaR1
MNDFDLKELVKRKRLRTEAIAVRKLRLAFGIRGRQILRAAGLMAIAVAFAFGSAHGTSGSAQEAIQSSATNSPAYKFEVATIRPSRPSNDGGGGFEGDAFRVRNFPLKQIIKLAYGIYIQGDRLIEGSPSWLESERYDIVAKMDAATADRLKKLSPDERTQAQNQMLQELFADRLKLAIHRETRELSVYALTVAKNGPKLKKAKPGDTYENAFPYANKYADATELAGKYFVVRDGGPARGTTTMYAFGVSVHALAMELKQLAGGIVQDRTGITGSYDFTLKFCNNPSSPGPSAAAADGQAVPSASEPCGVPALFTAIQQQLGLKLEVGKGPVEVIVIDHVERPSGN